MTSKPETKQPDNCGLSRRDFVKIGAITGSAAAFLVVNAFMMTVTQQQKEIGLLRALGMTRRQVQRQLLLEAWFTGGAGTLAGLAKTESPLL